MWSIYWVGGVLKKEKSYSFLGFSRVEQQFYGYNRGFHSVPARNSVNVLELQRVQHSAFTRSCRLLVWPGSETTNIRPRCGLLFIVHTHTLMIRHGGEGAFHMDSGGGAYWKQGLTWATDTLCIPIHTPFITSVKEVHLLSYARQWNKKCGLVLNTWLWFLIRSADAQPQTLFQSVTDCFSDRLLSLSDKPVATDASPQCSLTPK